ncbi:uncharacterized protein LOC118764868 [Octopus sinensis]|uniref:Uncharacterized protein LOC118764868 n=1 Tax=Octopus sinensis TaxID=2607531 RepID=A0A7E6F318_9MOLL|nr:uncharacterized protein LOC118764868 [Octopus sinensis]XP_036361918.1 uncharacterized protein LOC118764868 [Octopus sinensis]
MNNSQKDILRKYIGFLAQNIIWTNDLCKEMVCQDLLTNSMMEDIKESYSKQEKVTKLIEWLCIREKKSYHKFCDVLQICGHTFVADFLRDEERENNLVDLHQIFDNSSLLKNNVTQEERQRLTGFITQKVKELKLMYAWKKENSEKEKMLEVKNQQLEQFYEFKVLLNAKNTEIEELKKITEQYKTEYCNLQLKINAFEKEIANLKAKHTEDLLIQIRSNHANESTKDRIAGKLRFAESLLRNIHKCISQTISLKPRTKDTEEIALVENEFAFLWEDFENFHRSFLELKEIKKHYTEMQQGNEWILTHMGFRPHEQNAPSVVNAYKDFIFRSDENIINLKKDIYMKNQLLRDKNALIQSLLLDTEINSDNTQPKKVHSLRALAMTMIRQQMTASGAVIRENNENAKKSVNNAAKEGNTTKNKLKVLRRGSKRKGKTVKEMRKSEERNAANISSRIWSEIKEEINENDSIQKKISSLPSIDHTFFSLPNPHYQQQTKKFSMRNGKMSNNMSHNYQLPIRQSSTSFLDGLTANSIKIIAGRQGKKRLA